MSREIKFRTKFLELVKGQDIEALEAAVCKFIQMDPDSALDYLWRMTYESDEDISKTMNELGLADVSVDRIKLRNELRHQYGSSIMQKPSEEYFAEMEKRSDTITAFVVWKRCERKLMVTGPAEINRMLFLVSASLENYYFGGLREIGFTTEESGYLKQFHEEIGNLLESMWTEASQPFGNQLGEALNAEWTLNESSEETSTKYNLPSALDETEQTAEDPEPQKETTEDPEPQKQGYIPVTPEEVLRNREVFESFATTLDITSLESLGSLGYDLNEILMKRHGIKDFLNAAKELEG